VGIGVGVGILVGVGETRAVSVGRGWFGLSTRLRLQPEVANKKNINSRDIRLVFIFRHYNAGRRGCQYDLLGAGLRM